MRGFLFMYLKKLYKQNKFWFVIVVLFAAGQLFFNYKNGVEFSPFYHYSMFSIKFSLKPDYEATEVVVNGKPLQSKDFTPNGWDNIVIPITQYEAQQSWNNLIYNTSIKRLLHTNDSTLYTNRLTKAQFDNWYQHRLIRLLQLTDTTADIQYNIVSYKQKSRYLYR